MSILVGKGGIKIGFSGRLSWESYVSKIASFQSWQLDFDTNQWLDKSGNDNHATLKGASARTGNGANLDYTITGLLTTDTITVETGSDTPTIPVNGTLRIGGAQTVYGVTIKRAGAILAVIPFCEPVFEGFLPVKSYDVSGNRNHASCPAIALGNITTQDNYFYLMEHGYTYGEQLHEDYDLANDPSGVPNGWTAGATYHTELQATWMGTYWRFAYNGIPITSQGNFYKSGITELDVLNTYFLVKTIRRANETILVGQDKESSNGFIRLLTHNVSGNYYFYNKAPSNALLDTTNSTWLTSLNFFNTSPTHDSSFFAVNPYINGNTLTPTYLDIKRVVVCLPIIVPAELDGVESATGFEIEVEQDGTRLLRYAGSIEFPDTAINQATKPIYGEIIKTGILENGETYLVESNDNSIFSVDVHETFVSDGTEMPDKYNAVRKQLSASLLYTGAVTNTLGYSDFFEWNPHLSYAEKIMDYISTLIIVRGDYFLNNAEHLYMADNMTLRESIRGRYWGFWFDSFDDTKFGAMVDALDVINIKCSMAINYGMTLSEANVTLYENEGHDVEVHSQVALPSYKGFKDIYANYTASELRAYYAAVIAYHESKGWETPICKVYPGGGYDKQTTEVASEYFEQGRTVGQAYYDNRNFTDDWYKEVYDYALYKKWYKLGAVSTDTLSYNLWKADVDELIALSEGIGGIYIHMESKDITQKYDDDGNIDPLGETFIEKIIKLFNYCATNGVRVVTCRRLGDFVKHTDLP